MRAAVLILAFLGLLLLYRTATFPVLGFHSPACLCDSCLEASGLGGQP